MSGIALLGGTAEATVDESMYGDPHLHLALVSPWPPPQVRRVVPSSLEPESCHLVQASGVVAQGLTKGA